jgi:hypothetical protein
LADQFDDGGSDGDEDDRRQNKKHEGGNHFDRSFGGLLFGALPALSAEGIGVYAQSLSDAGAETIGLDECTHKRANVIDTGALDEVAEGLGARLAGAHLEVDEMKFIAEIGVGVVQILADPHQSLVERESGLHANDGEVEGIGKSDADAALAIPNQALEDETRQKESKSAEADEQSWIRKPGKQCHEREADSAHQNAGAEVVVDVAGVAKSGLDEKFASRGNVGGRQWQGFADGVEGLLEALFNRGLVLDRLLLLAAEGAQARSEDGTGRNYGSSESKHRDCNGHEYDDNENQWTHNFKPESG